MITADLTKTATILDTLRNSAGAFQLFDEWEGSGGWAEGKRVPTVGFLAMPAPAVADDPISAANCKAANAWAYDHHDVTVHYAGYSQMLTLPLAELVENEELLDEVVEIAERFADSYILDDELFELEEVEWTEEAVRDMLGDEVDNWTSTNWTALYESLNGDWYPTDDAISAARAATR